MPPTVGKLIEISLVQHCLRLMVFAAVIALAATSLGDIYLALFLIGLLVGSMGRDVAQFRYTVHMWPVLQVVMDWNRIDELLQPDESRGSPST